MICLLVIGYSLGALLPGIALVAVFVRARRKFQAFTSNKKKREAIDGKFNPRLKAIQSRMASLDSLTDSEEPLHVQQANILNERTEAYAAAGVTYLSYGRVEKEMEEVFDGKPIDNYSLAIQDVWLIGLGLLFGSITSIASLFV